MAKKRHIVCDLDNATPTGTKAHLFVNIKKKKSTSITVDPSPKLMDRKSPTRYRRDNVTVDPPGGTKVTVLRVLVTYPDGQSYFLDGKSPDHT